MITLMGNSSFNYFVTNAILVIGLKFSSSSLSRVVSLIFRQTAPSLKALGKIPLSNDELTRVIITGTSFFVHAFRVRVGMGSRGDDFERDFLISSCTILILVMKQRGIG